MTYTSAVDTVYTVIECSVRGYKELRSTDVLPYIAICLQVFRIDCTN